MSTTYLRPILTPVDLASIEVSQYVRECAQTTAETVGFGWIGTPDAPSTYQQLRAAYQESTTSGEPLPISNLACEPSIYARAEDNVAFRFWHDVHHVTFGLSFSLEDELELPSGTSMRSKQLDSLLDQHHMHSFRPTSWGSCCSTRWHTGSPSTSSVSVRLALKLACTGDCWRKSGG